MKIIRNLILFCLFLFEINIVLGQENKILPLDLYLSRNNTYKLDHVIKVESSDDILTLYGYHKDDNFTLHKKQIKLNRYQVLKVSQFNSREHRISLMTIPFKIRPIDQKTIATSGLSNIGVNFNLFTYEISNYFSSGKKSQHLFSLGLVIAPGVEVLDSTLTMGRVTDKSKQLFIGCGIDINYSYNNITLSLIPLGYDIATTSVGRTLKYKRWWGLGVGIEPKFLAPK